MRRRILYIVFFGILCVVVIFLSFYDKRRKTHNVTSNIQRSIETFADTKDTLSLMYPENLAGKVLVGTLSDTVLSFYLSEGDTQYQVVNKYDFTTSSPLWICLPYGITMKANFVNRDKGYYDELTGDTVYEYRATTNKRIAPNTPCLIFFKPVYTVFPFDTSCVLTDAENSAIKRWFNNTAKSYTTDLLDTLASHLDNLDTVITYPQKYTAIKLTSQSQHQSFFVIFFIHSLSFAKGYSSIALAKIVNNEVVVIFEKHSISAGDVFMGYTYEAMFPSETKGNASLLIKDNRDDYHINLIYSFDPAAEKVTKDLEYAQ